MPNAFERHGIDHLSAGSCNLFAAEPALWAMENLLGLKGRVGAAAFRGRAAECGITAGLIEGKSDDDAVAVGVAEYGCLTALSADPNREKEGAAIAGIIKQGLHALRAYGVPSDTQRRIEWQPDELGIPFVGYVDFEWDEFGVILDLKTQLRLASQIARNHARQVALYGVATSDNADLRISYVTPSKSATYQLENARAHCAALLKIALTIGRFLSVSNDPHELAGIVAPNIDSFYWNNPDTRQAAFEVYGI